MSTSNDKDPREEEAKKLIGGIGGYVIKISEMYISTYQHPLLIFGKKSPEKLAFDLTEVKEILHDKDEALQIAQKVNGKVYTICIEPVEDE